MRHKNDFDPLEYEAAFLLNHFLNYCRTNNYAMPYSSHSAKSTIRNYSIVTEHSKSEGSKGETQAKNDKNSPKSCDGSISRSIEMNFTSSVSNISSHSKAIKVQDTKSRCLNCYDNIKKLQKEKKLIQKLLYCKLEEIRKLEKLNRKLKVQISEDSKKSKKENSEMKIPSHENKNIKENEQENLDNKLVNDQNSQDFDIRKDLKSFHMKDKINYSVKSQENSISSTFSVDNTKKLANSLDSTKLNLKNEFSDNMNTLKTYNDSQKSLVPEDLKNQKIFIQNENFLKVKDNFPNEKSDLLHTPFLKDKMSKNENTKTGNLQFQIEDSSSYSTEKHHEDPRSINSPNYYHSNYRNSYVINTYNYSEKNEPARDDHSDCESVVCKDECNNRVNFPHIQNFTSCSGNYFLESNSNKNFFNQKTSSMVKEKKIENSTNKKIKNEIQAKQEREDAEDFKKMDSQEEKTLIDKKHGENDELVCKIAPNYKYFEINPIEDAETEANEDIEGIEYGRSQNFGKKFEHFSSRNFSFDRNKRNFDRNMAYPGREYMKQKPNNPILDQKRMRFSSNFEDCSDSYEDHSSDKFSIEGVERPKIESKFNMKEHTENRISNGFGCDYCSEEFDELKRLVNHLMSTHSKKMN